MPRSPRPALATAFLLATFFSLNLTRADTVTLKTGEKFIGDISFEDDQHIVLNVPVSAGITDQRRILRVDIAKIEKKSSADTDFEKIETLKPGSASLTAERYDTFIQQLEQYRKNHPDSQFNAVVADRIAAFQAEKKRVDGGEIKFEGEWISKVDAEKRRYQIVAQLLYNQMLEAARRRDYITVLNTFDRISKNYPGSRAYVEAVPLALQSLGVLSQDVARRKRTLARDLQAREEGIQITSEPRKSQLIAAGKREEAQYSAAIQAAAASGLAWPPLISRSMDSLEKIESQIPNAESRLKAIDLAPMQASIANLEEAKRLFADGHLDEAAAKIDEARKLWSQNEALDRWQETLKEAQETTKMAPATEKKDATSEKVTPTPTPANPIPTPTPAEEAKLSVTPEDDKAESETPFFLTIPGAAGVFGVVIVSIGMVSLLGRVKNPAGDASTRDRNPEK